MRKTAGKKELVVNKMETSSVYSYFRKGSSSKDNRIVKLHFAVVQIVDLRIVIPRNEKTLWEKVNPQWVDYLYCVDKNWRVEEIRQHILDKFSKNLHLVLDDDLTLYKKLEKRRWEKN